MQIVLLLLLSIIHIHAREPFVITVFSLPHIKFRENLLLLSKLQEREREEGKKRGEVAVPQRKNMTNDIALDVKAVLFLERKGDYYLYVLLSLP